jgi:hypothetical protein
MDRELYRPKVSLPQCNLRMLKVDGTLMCAHQRASPERAIHADQLITDI